ncbi:DUF1190 family protein [Alteromonadaceae bacterium BrNp21-10]|nr:DUF1190 family protein [Alteromonadaceae bacterium BrNp21-10]
MTIQRKRSSNINLHSMRKHFTLKPLVIGMAGVLLSACGAEKQQATVYTNENDCVSANPGHEQECRAAYKDAVAEAERTGPKYNSQRDCEYEFGASQCRQYNSSGGSFFMPFMAGYMLSSFLSPGPYHTQPMYTSYSRNSPYNSRWITADGRDYGDLRNRNLRVGQNAYKPKPAVTKTMQRGGFGSSVRAKSSWGSSSKSSWGG